MRQLFTLLTLNTVLIALTVLTPGFDVFNGSRPKKEKGFEDFFRPQILK